MHYISVSKQCWRNLTSRFVILQSIRHWESNLHTSCLKPHITTTIFTKFNMLINLNVNNTLNIIKLLNPTVNSYIHNLLIAIKVMCSFLNWNQLVFVTKITKKKAESRFIPYSSVDRENQVSRHRVLSGGTQRRVLLVGSFLLYRYKRNASGLHQKVRYGSVLWERSVLTLDFQVSSA